MNREEALAFLGLMEPVNKEAVQERFSERQSYFQMLYSNAPNKVIRHLQQQNLDKLATIKQVLLASASSRQRQAEKPSAARKWVPVHSMPEEKGVLGWLILHTENRKPRTFQLYEGVNFIGRKKSTESGNSIVIDDDPFVSRTHAFIKCRIVEGEYEFRLYDGDGGKPSINGVFVNGDETRINGQYELQENDTFQVGSTKLVLKVSQDNTTESREMEKVLNTDFIRTINVGRKK